MRDLRKALIRLAHENPEMRADLLPLLKSAAPGNRELQSRVDAVNDAAGAVPVALRAIVDWFEKNAPEHLPVVRKQAVQVIQKNSALFKRDWHGNKALGKAVGDALKSK
jgi:hypothetical protein